VIVVYVYYALIRKCYRKYSITDNFREITFLYVRKPGKFLTNEKDPTSRVESVQI